MKKSLLVLALLFSLVSFAQSPVDKSFPPEELFALGSYYYPEQWDSSQWERDLKKMSEMGIKFTHFAEFAWAMMEPEEGKYDFEWLDRAVSLAEKYGLKVIMCTSVSIMEAELLAKILPKEHAEALKNLNGDPENLKSTEIAGLKPHYLLLKTVGKDPQTFLAVRLDDLCIHTPGDVIHIAEPVFALTFESSALGKEYKLLLNSRLLR